ncbi:MAG TPA: alpha/beta hydrolase [Terracidiphilus sp.]|nr:alpha/beta hydrolase [Terracidiphilus sp.]
MRSARMVGIVAALLLAAGIGFLMRPVSYFDGALYLRDALAGVKSRTVSVHGYSIHYLVEGPDNAPAVVLVHGLGGRAEDWRSLAPYLVKAGFRVLMPDLLGYGRSPRPADFSYSVRDEAGIVIGFLDALQLKQVDLGGWSMGGWIVQIVASEAPERVKRLMLFDAAGLYAAPDWDTRLFTPITAQELAQLEALLTPHPEVIPGFVSHDILRISREHAWVMHRAMTSMLTGADVTDRLLPELKMPVLLVWGSQDHIIPADQAEKIHRLIPQSQLDLVGSCGHLAPLECAGVIGPRVIAFVKQ